MYSSIRILPFVTSAQQDRKTALLTREIKFNVTTGIGFKFVLPLRLAVVISTYYIQSRQFLEQTRSYDLPKMFVCVR